MEGSGSINNRLFRHDCKIMINTVRATLAGWHDRLIAAVMLLAALATIRLWFVDRPWATAAWVACGAGIILGSGAERLVATRLGFHDFDGLLSADSLHQPTRRHYRAAWHGIGLVLLTTITLIARPSLLLVSVAGYLAGVLVARLMNVNGFRMPGMAARRTRPRWVIQSWLNYPAAGAAAAVLLLLFLLPARALGTSALAAVAGIETTLIVLALTIVDDGIVRFMTIAGHGSRYIVARHGKSMALFVAVAVPGCWLILGPVVAGIVAAASFALLLLLILRILAYRLHGKRFADFLVSILVGFLILAAYAMPVALPFVAIAIVWHLQRRGKAKAWLLE
jgi:hypothetical protein